MGKTLNLILKYKWYEKIEKGEKTKEYREHKPYWDKRFTYPKHLEFDKVRFQKGYRGCAVNRKPKQMIFEIKKIYLTHDEPNDLNIKSVWVIELGERIKQ